MRNCEHCGSEKNYGDIERWRFAGGYHAFVCVPCVNVRTKSELAERKPLMEFAAMRDAAIQAGDIKQAEAFAGKVNEEEKRLFVASKAWVQSGKTGKGQ